MTYAPNDVVQLRFSHTENEYLAAVRLYFWNSIETQTQLIVTYVLLSAGLLSLPLLLNVSFPLWFLLILVFFVGLGLFHRYTIDLPRRYFRGDPKFREEYNLTFT